jgi:protein-S-isoprenylcysteine O-methyltransferase Ste14
MNMKFVKFSIVSASLLPLFALAVFDPNALTNTFGTVISSLVPIFMTLALLVFIWGLIKYISSAGDPEKAKEGKSIMIWGVVALFVMATIWGLTGTIATFFGVDNGTAPSGTDLTPSN